MKATVFAYACAAALSTLAAISSAHAQLFKIDFVSPYAIWKYGPPKRQDYFPLAVWLQSPRNAARYKELGINLYVGLWKGPIEEQLAQLKEVGMQVICDQNEVGLKHLDDPIIIGWMHGDEPDNAQPKEGGGYGPAIPPAEIIRRYLVMKANDPDRPVLLNLGQGIANETWIGKGCHWIEYYRYVRGADIVSYDIYPANSMDRFCPQQKGGLQSATGPFEVETPKGKTTINLEPIWSGKDCLFLVARGVMRLRELTCDLKPVWNAIEVTHIREEGTRPTPEMIRAEVWMSIIAGSKGIIYFCHSWYPQFNESVPLSDPEVGEAIRRVNAEVTQLAPIINAPNPGDIVSIQVEGDAPVLATARFYNDAIYIFAIGMRALPTKATFTIRPHLRASEAEAVGEGRTLRVVDRSFSDSFSPWQVHIYRIPVSQ
ncbi:MAG: hypothetical protein H5T86_05255 [Armatimonadetes bacterium]|nr:hypothetical protein [Armatimonadota bacterium]